MGAQSKLEHRKTSNLEKCLICYGPHTATDEERGISFELKNLKEIFLQYFNIQFLPHFSNYGRVHMCVKCHVEFLKVSSLYGDLDGRGNNLAAIDAARERLAFIVVESVVKSQYINNYVHGNAFDAIRYLVFKEWGCKFRKQKQISRSELEKEQGVLCPSVTLKNVGLNPVAGRPDVRIQVENEKTTVAPASEKDLNEVFMLGESTNLGSISAIPHLIKTLKSEFNNTESNEEDSNINSLPDVSAQATSNNSLIIKSSNATIKTEIKFENGTAIKQEFEKLDSSPKSSNPHHLEDTIKTPSSLNSSSTEERVEGLPKKQNNGSNSDPGSNVYLTKEVNTVKTDPESISAGGSQLSICDSPTPFKSFPAASNGVVNAYPLSAPKFFHPVSLTTMNSNLTLPQTSAPSCSFQPQGPVNSSGSNALAKSMNLFETPAPNCPPKPLPLMDFALQSPRPKKKKVTFQDHPDFPILPLNLPVTSPVPNPPAVCPTHQDVEPQSQPSKPREIPLPHTEIIPLTSIVFDRPPTPPRLRRPRPRYTDSLMALKYGSPHPYGYPRSFSRQGSQPHHHRYHPYAPTNPPISHSRPEADYPPKRIPRARNYDWDGHAPEGRH